MPSSAMFRSVGLVRTDVSEETIATIIRVKRIGELGITLAIANSRSTLRAYVPSETSVLKEPHRMTSQKTAFFITNLLTISTEGTNLFPLYSPPRAYTRDVSDLLCN
jgi:hypothetical protein